MSQTNGLVKSPQCLLQSYANSFSSDQTCLLPHMASHLSQHPPPRPLHHPPASPPSISHSHTPLPRPPRIPDSSPAHGQTQTDLGPVNGLRRLRRGDKLLAFHTTGKKRWQKTYYRHNTRPGSLKSVTMDELMKKLGGAEVLRKAVSGMLPKNRLRDDRLVG
jgi:hypothetical protein